MSKTALVLLHGFCENNSLWDPIIPALTFDGEIITPNLPGFGNTHLKSIDFNLTDIATSIYNGLIAAGVNNCICIGHSLGGYVTLALKDKYPDFVIKMGLLHSTAYPDSIEKKDIRNKLIAFLDRHPASSFLSTFAPSLFSEVNKDRLKDEIEKVIEMSKGVETKTIQGYARAMRDRKDYSALLFDDTEPLFISGIDDNAVPIEDSKNQIARIQNKTHCQLLENVAHMGMYESPSIIIRAINQFC